MAGWRVHRGQAVALPLDNLDTDQLIPARFMSQPRAAGYGGFLLHDLRRDVAGEPDPAFPLNRHPGASILVAGRNFGSGSSREAAVYALVDAGIRAVVAESFGDIFAANAVNNGLLPARVAAADAAALTAALGAGTAEATVDLDAGEIALGDLTIGFALDETWRTKLANGWDDIDLTGRHADEIARFRAARRQTAPWAWPRGAA